MAIDKLIKDAAEHVWREMKQRQDVYFPVKDFSPESLWVVEQLFASPQQLQGGGLLCFEYDHLNPNGEFEAKEKQKRVIWELGAYIGEVVRRYYADKLEWTGVLDLEMELLLPPIHPPLRSLMPMAFIDKAVKDLKNYKKGGIVEWARAGGVTVLERPKNH